MNKEQYKHLHYCNATLQAQRHVWVLWQRAVLECMFVGVIEKGAVEWKFIP